MARSAPLIVIGLMSGTSADAIDAAVVEIARDDDTLLLGLRGYCEQPYPRETLARIRALLPPATGSTAAICELNVLIGEAFATAALAAARIAAIPDAAIDLIASHGQTIYHQVAPGHIRSTLQLGAPAVVAERTGCTVAADFRPRDIAAGGQGAPLAPYLDTLLCADATSDRVLLNIGGIANLTYIPAGAPHEALAFDSGPGNALIDEAVRQLSNDQLQYDEGGAWAARGAVDEFLLAQWLKEPYFGIAPPKSTGRELFSREDAARRVTEARARGCDPAAILATLTALTARALAAAMREFLPAIPTDIYVSGGGAHNKTLVRQLAAALPQSRIRRFDELGLRGDAKEAVLFATLGYATLHAWPANVPRCTGATHLAVLGTITPGTNYMRLLRRALATDAPRARRARIQP